MKRFMLAFLLLIASVSFCAEPVIVVPENVTPVEMNAARELRDLLRLSTHKYLPITHTAPAGAPAFFIGNCPAASARLREPFKEDEIFLKPFPAPRKFCFFQNAVPSPLPGRPALYGKIMEAQGLKSGEKSATLWVFQFRPTKNQGKTGFHEYHFRQSKGGRAGRAARR